MGDGQGDFNAKDKTRTNEAVEERNFVRFVSFVIKLTWMELEYRPV
jgi:hypothetical protein